MKQRNAIYQKVTDQIIEALEAGTRPWDSPFLIDIGSLPKRSTGQNYKGINILILSIASMINDWTCPYWFTFKQAKDIGANVTKGSKSTEIVFYKSIKVKDEETGEETTVPVLKSYRVFNGTQLENLPKKYIQPVDELPAHEKIESVEDFFRSTGIEYSHMDTTPHFNSSTNQVKMPDMNRYKAPEYYYADLGHEFIHATGHKSRLDRDLSGTMLGTKKQKESYAFEELVAEIGASFLMPTLGVKSYVNDYHAPYIDGYLQILKSDNKFIFQAAAKAQQAVDYLLDQHAQNQKAA